MKAIIPKMIGKRTIEATPKTVSPIIPCTSPMLGNTIAAIIPSISPQTIPNRAWIFAHDMMSMLLISCIFTPIV
jgi:hypothetical protein